MGNLLNMMAPRTDLSEEEFDTAFGLHSGYPQCCVWARNEGLIPYGSCKTCHEAGIDRCQGIHYCSYDHPDCATYLEVMESRWVTTLSATLATVDDWDYCVYMRRPLCGEAREIIQTSGFRMAHLCWPPDHGYCYIFRRPFDDKRDTTKTECIECGSKYSVAFPTAGTP
jgi:hypothetical protein